MKLLGGTPRGLRVMSLPGGHGGSNTGTSGKWSFFSRAVFRRKDKEIISVSAVPARILSLNYPDRLRDVCEEFLAHASPDAHPGSLAEAVRFSRLPKETRLRILSEMAGQGSRLQQASALVNLARLDEKRCVELLRPLLDQIPPDADGRYWVCQEASFTYVLKNLEDNGAWGHYLRVAKRCSVGLRMEMMGPMTYAYKDKARPQRLAFLAAFLDDEAVRDMAKAKDKFDGPCAGFTIEKIAVQDFAALQLSYMLGFDDAPDEFWDAKQWSKLREKVRGKVRELKLPDLAADQGNPTE
jgi:hypothetical protein